jgi:hypothetical protein
MHLFYVVAHLMFLSLQVSYLAADSFFPEWNVWIQFLEESTTGFRLDALAGSHPIEVTIISSLSACYAIASNISINFSLDPLSTFAMMTKLLSTSIDP